MLYFHRMLLLVICFISLLFSVGSKAVCIKVTDNSFLSDSAIKAGYTARNWYGAFDDNIGHLGLPSVISVSTSNKFQPAGTVLASSIANFLTSATRTPYSAKQILFRCELKDAGQLYELYSTNGDNIFVGGRQAKELGGAYYDVERNVAVRMTNLSTGEYYSRYWKQRQLTADSWFQDDHAIYIPASAFSNILYEMIKISASDQFIYAGRINKDTYNQPRGYIAFKGPGLDTFAIQEGDDHANKYLGWPYVWPGAWGTYNQVTYIRGATCTIEDYPSIVILPQITVRALSSGQSSQATFSLTLNCESGAMSSTHPTTNIANVAMGFLVNQPTAVAAARRLGLTTSGGGLTWLLDTHYGEKGVASGVGIKIYDKQGAAINLLPDRMVTASGSTRGWYAYKDLTTFSGTKENGSIETWHGDFTASLEALSGQTVTVGSVNAQLQAVVSFQ